MKNKKTREPRPWTCLSSAVMDRNPFWTYKIDEYEIPGKGTGTYYYVHTAGSAFIVPVTDDDKILLVQQYRYLNRRLSWEFPGGGIKEGEIPADVAQKELIEETGFSGRLQPIGQYNPYNGVTNEICHAFMATHLKPSSEFQPDASEEFVLRAFSFHDIENMIADNEIFDGMTLAVWAICRHRLKEILLK